MVHTVEASSGGFIFQQKKLFVNNLIDVLLHQQYLSF